MGGWGAITVQWQTVTHMPSSLLALLDDIASVLDDVAVLTKVAAKKTAGVLGDDLALNAEQVSGVNADRELPVVWAVAKGSLVNKAILVPAALAISALAPWGVVPLLMIGGAFLCYEGVEKLVHKFLHKQEDDAHQAELLQAVANPEIDLVQLEKDKIKGAVRTDFVLSAEIIAISLGAVADASFAVRVASLIAIALIMTVGVYGFVGAIVKIDDLGLYLSRRESGVARTFGKGLLLFAPKLMKALTIAGTAAMFLVGGGILVHGIPPLHHLIQNLAHGAGPLGWLVDMVGNALVGVVAGAILVPLVALVIKLVQGMKRGG